MRRNKISTGLILIGVAVFMMLSSLGFIPDIPWFKLFCCAFLVSWTLRALLDRDFFGTFLSASIIAWIFDEELMIEHLVPFPLCAAAALLGIGLNMIFGKKKKIVSYEYTDKNGNWKEGNIDDVRSEEWQDGRTVVLQNNFNSTNKYVNSASFSTAKLENNFGSANIYFNNATICGKEAVVELENNFGQMNIYFPNNWRASISQDSAFGRVNVFGEPNRDMDAPCVIVKAEANFGVLNIYFE
jgi:predicted membrane protein